MIYKEDFDQSYKERLLGILHKVLDEKKSLSDGDALVYFHWAAHKDDPAYSFIPERYREWEADTLKI